MNLLNIGLVLGIPAVAYGLGCLAAHIHDRIERRSAALWEWNGIHLRNDSTGRLLTQTEAEGQLAQLGVFHTYTVDGLGFVTATARNPLDQ